MLQAAQAQAQEAEAALKALRADSERAKQQSAEQHAKLESQLAELKQQLQRATSDRKLQVWNKVSSENLFTTLHAVISLCKEDSLHMMHFNYCCCLCCVCKHCFVRSWVC